jgi:hypothetical protein
LLHAQNVTKASNDGELGWKCMQHVLSDEWCIGDFRQIKYSRRVHNDSILLKYMEMNGAEDFYILGYNEVSSYSQLKFPPESWLIVNFFQDVMSQETELFLRLIG